MLALISVFTIYIWLTMISYLLRKMGEFFGDTCAQSKIHPKIPKLKGNISVRALIGNENYTQNGIFNAGVCISISLLAQ
jgi:hypothetical protein